MLHRNSQVLLEHSESVPDRVVPGLYQMGLLTDPATSHSSVATVGASGSSVGLQCSTVDILKSNSPVVIMYIVHVTYCLTHRSFHS